MSVDELRAECNRIIADPWFGGTELCEKFAKAILAALAVPERTAEPMTRDYGEMEWDGGYNCALEHVRRAMLDNDSAGAK